MSKPAEKRVRSCEICGSEFSDTTYGRFCPTHRAAQRKSALARHHYLTTTYRPTDEIDSAIRRVFLEGDGSLNGLAKKFRWSINAMSRRAATLGFSRPKRGKVWSLAEIDCLERNAHLSAVTIAKKFRTRGFHRSESSIRTKLGRMNLPRGDDNTASSVGVAFGVQYATVVRWINLGLLKSRRRGGDLAKYGRDWHIIPLEAIRDFVLANPLEFDIRKVDQLWFIDLVSGGKIKQAVQPENDGDNDEIDITGFNVSEAISALIN